MTRRPKRLLLIVPVLLVILVIGLVATLGFDYAGEISDRFGERGPTGTLADLQGVDQLRTSFNDSVGTPRLVLLLSPT